MIPSDNTWWESAFPAVRWLRSYQREWLRPDLVAGITLAAYLLPAALGDASLANLPPQAGLYACLFGGLVFWVFCSSRQTVVSVTSAISLVIGSSLGEITGGNILRFGALAAGTALLVAAIAFIAWLVKAGVLVHFISESVLTGFKCGVALFLASTQLPKLFGFHGAHGSFWENAGFFLKHLSETNATSLLVGGIALGLLILGKIFLRHKPVALFVVLGGIVTASVLSLEARGVKLIGAIPEGIPPLKLPLVYWSDLNQLLALAFACFLLSAVETAAIGRMFVAKHGGQFDANQENLALAASNLAAGLGGGFPVGGGTSQSLVNESGGGRTPLSTVFATAFILAVVLFFSHLLRALPQPVLAAVVLAAVASLFNLATLQRLWRSDRDEFVVAIAAFIGVLTFGLLRGVMIGAAKEDRARFNQLLKNADVFFANKRPGFLKKHGLDAESLCEQKPGLIHAIVAMHGEKGPWSSWPGFDEIGAAVSGLFAIEGSPTRPQQPPIVPIADNVVGWLGTAGILAALRRRAIEGGSYRVVVSLTRTVLWLLSLGIFDKAYAKAVAGSTDEHKYIAPDLFTAETPLGTYQGMTDQIVLSRTPGAYRTVLVPHGSSKPEWLPNVK